MKSALPGSKTVESKSDLEGVSDSLSRCEYDLKGVVQGVGFRPALCRLARKADLGGWVQNRSGTVRLVLEGKLKRVEQFIVEFPKSLPDQAKVTELKLVESHSINGRQTTYPFLILESRKDSQRNIVIPTDLATCSVCQKEIFDSRNRRYGYAFTTCTDCGPRYTVVHATPYDRQRTTLEEFPLCELCEKEYETLESRRFHAESICCAKCGPHLQLLDAYGEVLSGDPLSLARAELAQGKIVAVKGIGGYLLAADVFNEDTLRRLRTSKRRPHKALAVMARDLSVVRSWCEVSEEAEELLTSVRAPIVILPLRKDVDGLPRDFLAPDTKTLGVMLPYSPLHHLLFSPLEDDETPAFDGLVMTSGNRRGEPISVTNEEALVSLSGIADLFLVHNRKINLRSDDSLIAIQPQGAQMWRRSRGYVPESIPLKHTLKHCVVGMGAEMKNTIALGWGQEVVLSSHVGDLETPEARGMYRQVIEDFSRFFDRKPEVIAVDMHPDMYSSCFGRAMAREWGIPCVEVQHHYAHAVSCLVEHGVESGLALVFDGTGMGEDGAIWGAELLDVQPHGYQRYATFKSSALLGGDAAVLHPVRQLVARWLESGISISEAWQQYLGITHDQIAVWNWQLERGVNTPVTHSAGRLFDAFAAAMGLSHQAITYEGQAAIRLETCVREQGNSTLRLPFDLCEKEGFLEVDWAPMFEWLANESPRPEEQSQLAWVFHEAVATAAWKMIEHGLDRTTNRTVVLSGGVWMNQILNELLVPKLKDKGLKVLTHQKVPPNDGGISLGQVVIANQQRIKE